MLIHIFKNLVIFQSELLDKGKMFGKVGKGFQRLNIALPKKKLEWAMKQLDNTFKDF